MIGAPTLGQAVVAKLRLVAKYGRTGPALRRGLAMLARGDFAGLWRKTFQALDGPDLEGREPYDEAAAYAAWRQARALTDADRERLRREAAALADPPLFSVLLHTAAAGPELHRSVESVRRQTYPRWELCVVRGSGWRDALAAATGDYITLLDAGDELAEHALSRLASAVARDCAPDMLYADEDRLSADGRRSKPYFKPDWSPDLFGSWMYTGRPGVYRTARVREVGGIGPEFGPAQEYDLALRVAADLAQVGHVPDILYHRARARSSPAPPPERTESASRSAAPLS